jgi:hypothetical protein
MHCEWWMTKTSSPAEVGTTGKGPQSLHQSPMRLAQLVDSTLRQPFIASLDKQSERYCTDSAEGFS